MTAASDVPGHLDPEALADLAEGLLGAADADAARQHLGSCPACADDYALISGDYSVSVAPEPIPAEVFARIEAALYREPPLVAAPSTAAAPQPAPRKTRELRSRRFKLAFSGLAGATALIVVGYFGMSALSSSSETKSSASTAAGSAAVPGPGHGNAEPFSADAGVEQLATRLLTNLRAAQHLTQPQAAGATPNEPGAKQCWYDPKPGVTPLASAPTDYLGQNAEVVVYAAPDDPTKADVFVVTASCASTSPQPGGVLTQLQVTRP